MTEHNVFDDHERTELTPWESSEVERYIEKWKNIERDEAAKQAQDLARQLMALSTLLSKDDGKAALPVHHSTMSTAETVKQYAESIHRRITEARH